MALTESQMESISMLIGQMSADQLTLTSQVIEVVRDLQKGESHNWNNSGGDKEC